MKFIFSSIFILLLLSAKAQIPTEKTLLWQIKGKGLNASSYLYGTIHLSCPDDIVVTPILKQKFKSTKQLYLEMDMDDPTLMTNIVTGMRMSDTTTITKLFATNFDTLNKIFQLRTGIPLQLMNNTKPIMLLALIYPSLMGCQPKSWEDTFMNLTNEANQETFGLETLQDQLDVFDTIPYKVQAEMLSSLLLNIDSAKNAFLKMRETYKERDIKKMYEETTGDKDFGAYEETLLINRNKNWIPIIINAIKKTPTFFAVGAGHLGGKNGVINLLRKAGIVVTPVYY